MIRRTKWLHVQWLAGVFGWLAAAFSCPQAALAETFARQGLSVGGVARSYLLYEPQHEGNGERPLVILLHGGGGSARQIADHVGAGFAALADQHGFYIVVPDAVDGSWDFGEGLVSEARARRVDDRAFFGALLDALPSQLPIDRRRVFATGISRGGQASYFMACSFPGRIRAIAPVAMPLPLIMRDACSQGPPVGLAIFNGVADPIVPYDGGWITIGRHRRDEVLSTEDTVALWRNRNACGTTPASFEQIDLANDGMRVEKTSWGACAETPVLLYRIVGGGHTWPGSERNLPEWLVGRINHDISATNEIWAFFSQFE